MKGMDNIRILIIYLFLSIGISVVFGETENAGDIHLVISIIALFVLVIVFGTLTIAG